MLRAAITFIVVFDLVGHYCDFKRALGLPNTCSYECEAAHDR
jgi:hypothetical protein